MSHQYRNRVERHRDGARVFEEPYSEYVATVCDICEEEFQAEDDETICPHCVERQCQNCLETVDEPFLLRKYEPFGNKICKTCIEAEKKGKD